MMPGTGASVFVVGSSPFLRQQLYHPATGKFKSKPFALASPTTSRLSVPSTEPPPLLPSSTKTISYNGRFEKKHEAAAAKVLKRGGDSEDRRPLSLKDYFGQSKDMIRRSDGGPPRWFSPLDCAIRLKNSPLLLFLPGIDGMGVGLTLHHKRLGEIYDMWCLHIPVMDRTPFTVLVDLVDRTVRSENCRSPDRPIYLVGESVGACLGLNVAAHNPDIDIILILANPATSFSKSQLQPLIPLAQIMPEQFHLTVPYRLSLMTGIPLKMVMATVEKRLPLQQTVGELSENIGTLSSYISILVDSLPRETLLWKLQMIRSASAYANSRLHAVKAQTLILSRWIEVATSLVMLSTLEDGKIVRGIGGIPSEGPVLFVGYHNLLGLELVPLVARFWVERNIVVRGIAHPMLFTKLRGKTT